MPLLVARCAINTPPPPGAVTHLAPAHLVYGLAALLSSTGQQHPHFLLLCFDTFLPFCCRCPCASGPSAAAGTFNGEGNCTSVPQLPEGQTLSRSRSCVSSYPTSCREGLLWVWPDASPAALIESADEAAWPGLAPEIDQHGEGAWSRMSSKHRWYARWVGRFWGRCWVIDRSCTWTNYKFLQREGLLWVWPWPDASPASLIESADEAACPAWPLRLTSWGKSRGAGCVPSTVGVQGGLLGEAWPPSLYDEAWNRS
jgi:hypothetical protein